MNTAVVTVFYPGIENFLSQFLSSLQRQSDQDFTLYVLNDGLADFDYWISQYSAPTKTYEVASHGTPAAVAKKSIKWLFEEAVDIAVLADADDYFEEKRIELCKKQLIANECVFHDLMLFGENFGTTRLMFGERFDETSIIGHQDLLHSNCIGFGNSAIKLNPDILSFLDSIPDDIVAFDWMFFSLFLRNTRKAFYLNDTYTFYRQHTSNLASPNKLTDDQIKKGIDIKIKHYLILGKILKSNQYLELADIFKNMKLKFTGEPEFFKEYCDLIQKEYLTRIPLWWEAIKPLNKEIL